MKIIEKKQFWRNERYKSVKTREKGYIPPHLFLGMSLAVICVMLFAGIGVATATDYYVSTTGSNSNSGLSEDQAWRTITYAATQAQAGDTVHIKGGDYGHEHVVITSSGTEGNPIVFAGYDGTPAIDGQDLTGTGILVDSREYIEIKNIKVTQYTNGVYLKYSNHIMLDGITGVNLGGTGSWDGNGIFLYYSDYCNLQNCNLTDAWMDGIIILHSNYNHIENCTVYSIGTEPSKRATDYYIIICYGHDNTIRNCLAHNMHPEADAHAGHGIGIKDDNSLPPHSYNNKIIDCVCQATYEPFFAANGAHDNEFINCDAYRADLNSGWHHGLTVRAGAYNNIFKSCTAKGFLYGIYLDPVGGEGIQHSNTFLNCILIDSIYGINLVSVEKNTFKNCVITRAGTLFKLLDGSDNSLTNCIITDTPAWSSGSGNPTITYSDFWNNGFSTPSGTGNMEKNPLFADLANDDFHLKETSPCIDAGDPSDGYSNEPLPNGERINMGAYANTVEASKSSGEISTGTISGTITNTTGAPIQGATIIANSYSDTTNISGGYTITLPVGTYTVTASKTGYFSLPRENVQVLDGQTTTVDFQLTEAPDLIGFWRFEEGSGTTAYDPSEYGNNGTINGATWTTEGKLGSALEFDGLDDYVEISNDTPLNTPTLTLMAWIKPLKSNSNNPTLFMRETSTGDNLFIVRAGIDSNGSSVGVSCEWSPQWWRASYDFQEAQWYHVATLIDGDQRQVYVNGEFVDEDIAPNELDYSYPGRFFIGQDQDGASATDFFNGVIDEVKIYNRVLSAEEIKADYEADVTGTISGTVTNTTGNPIEGATVSANSYSNTTNSAGCYTITLPVGNYTVTASKTRFQSQSKENVEVLENQVTEVNFTLAEATDLVGEWHFDEGDGTIAVDSSENSNDGTINGATRTTGILGSALQFDGVDDYVEVSNDASLNTPTLTLMAWIKPLTSNSNNPTLFMRETSTGDNIFLVRAGIDSNGSSVGVSCEWPPQYWTASYDFQEAQWYHVAALIDGNQRQVYVNGEFIDEDIAPNELDYSDPGRFFIGQDQDGASATDFFNGVIDEVRIYNCALSAEEIQADYEAGLNGAANTLSGTITSLNSTGLVDATVTLATMEGDVINSTLTDNTGNYEFADVAPGDYNITATKPRFWYNFSVITVNASVPATADILLYMKGDFNNNGDQADAGDLVMMEDAKEAGTSDVTYDLNGDGNLADEDDLTLLKKVSVGETVLE